MTGCSPPTGIVATRWHPLCRQSPQGFWLSPSSACVASENNACSVACAISAISLGAHATTIPTRNRMIASAKKASRADRRRASRRNAGCWRWDIVHRLAARCRVTQFQSIVFVQQSVQISFGHAGHQRHLDWKLGRTSYPPDLSASGRVNAEEATKSHCSVHSNGRPRRYLRTRFNRARLWPEVCAGRSARRQRRRRSTAG
jgi:hypothetical protein